MLAVLLEDIIPETDTDTFQPPEGSPGLSLSSCFQAAAITEAQDASGVPKWSPNVA